MRVIMSFITIIIMKPRYLETDLMIILYDYSLRCFRLENDYFIYTISVIEQTNREDESKEKQKCVTKEKRET